MNSYLQIHSLSKPAVLKTSIVFSLISQAVDFKIFFVFKRIFIVFLILNSFRRFFCKTYHLEEIISLFDKLNREIKNLQTFAFFYIVICLEKVKLFIYFALFNLDLKFKSCQSLSFLDAF